MRFIIVLFFYPPDSNKKSPPAQKRQAGSFHYSKSYKFVRSVIKRPLLSGSWNVLSQHPTTMPCHRYRGLRGIEQPFQLQLCWFGILQQGS